MYIHADVRRTIIDWHDNLSIKTCKIILVHEDCELGNHHHKIKTERFMLIRGSATITRDSEKETMTLCHPYKVGPDVNHSFSISKDSILLCIVNEVYDPSDDYAPELIKE